MPQQQDRRISVVIAAHNEAGVLGRCLDGIAGPDIEVVVVANACTDGTAAVARARPGVRVLELPEPGKAAALNAGDAVATGFPRVYLDADIALTAPDLHALAMALRKPGVLAATARRRLATRGRPLLVRAHAAINGRLPAYRSALFGRGVIALSRSGRARFDRFPDTVADDLFLDGLFAPPEKAEVPTVVAVVATPRRTGDLVRRLARVRAGNAALRATGLSARPGDSWSWLRHVALPRPWLLLAAVGYVAVNLVAARAGRTPGTGWGQDTSTRTTIGAAE